MEYLIFIDWDNRLNYDSLKCKVKQSLERMKELPILSGVSVKKIYWRLSSRRGVHLKLICEIPDLPERELFLISLIVRTAWKDDYYRIAIDLWRYGKYGDIRKTNRIFSYKYADGKFHVTSKWKELKKEMII